MDISMDEFMPLLRERVKAEAAIYSPVSLHRLYPFLVSHFNGSRIAEIMQEAVNRGVVIQEIGESKISREAGKLIPFYSLPPEPKPSHASCFHLEDPPPGN
jgi:hypothetical protein